MILPALLALALQQAPAPPESLLAAGDTAAAVRMLKRIAVGTEREVTDSGLAALFALSWIGRGPGQLEAQLAWHDRQVELHSWGRALGEASSVFLLAARLEPPLGRTNQLPAGLKAELAESLLALRGALGGTVEAAAASWAVALYHLDQIEGRIHERLPTVPEDVVTCVSWPQEVCVSRGDAARWARGLASFARDDSIADWLARARAELDYAAHGVWPFNELVPRVLGALAVVFDGDSDLVALRPRLRMLTERRRLRAELDVVLWSFAGRPDSAAAVMAEHPTWFNGLDADLTGLPYIAGAPPEVVWRTGWPLYLEPVNERQVAHRARLLVADVLRRLLPPDPTNFGFAWLSRVMIARGRPVALAQRGKLGDLHPKAIALADPRTHETLLPGDSVRRDTVPLDLGLVLARRGAPLASGFVAAHYDTLERFEHQVARYLEDGQSVVEIYAWRPAPLCSAPRPVTALFVLDQHLGIIRRSVDSIPTGTRLTYRVNLPPGAYVYSLEMLDRSCRQAARGRYVLAVRPVASGLDLSDPVIADLLYLDVLTRVTGRRRFRPRPTLTVEAGAPLRLYWEVYGVASPAAEPDRLEVTLQVVDVGSRRVPVFLLPEVARRATRTVPRLDLRYGATAPEGDGPIPMGLSVALPPGQAEGLYVARITVRDRRTGALRQSSRAFYFTPPER